MSSPSRNRSIAAAVGGIAAVLVVVLGIIVLVDSADDDSSTGDAAGTSSTTSTGSTGPESPSSTAPDPSSTESTAISLPDSVNYRPAARRAVGDGLAALVPGGLPGDMAVSAADYTASSGTWHLTVITASGSSIDLWQRDTDVADLVDTYASDSTEGGAVNLSAWQLGRWSSWSADGVEAIAHELPASSVIVVGSDHDEVVKLTKQLLTFESDGGGEGD